MNTSSRREKRGGRRVLWVVIHRAFLCFNAKQVTRRIDFYEFIHNVGFSEWGAYTPGFQSSHRACISDNLNNRRVFLFSGNKQWRHVFINRFVDVRVRFDHRPH